MLNENDLRLIFGDLSTVADDTESTKSELQKIRLELERTRLEMAKKRLEKQNEPTTAKPPEQTPSRSQNIALYAVTIGTIIDCITAIIIAIII